MKGMTRNTDPDTSKDAAESIAPHVSRLESIVLNAIKNSKTGLTTKEIAKKTRLERITVSPRVRPLCNKGLVEDSGTRRDKCIVWSAT